MFEKLGKKLLDVAEDVGWYGVAYASLGLSKSAQITSHFLLHLSHTFEKGHSYAIRRSYEKALSRKEVDSTSIRDTSNSTQE